MWLRQGAHLLNKLHEIWKICMMQHINKLQWNNAYYETRNIMFYEIYLTKLIYCVAWGYAAQLQTLSCSVVSIRKITTNCLQYFFWLCTELPIYCRYLWNTFHAIYFIVVRLVTPISNRSIYHRFNRTSKIDFSIFQNMIFDDGSSSDQKIGSILIIIITIIIIIRGLFKK